MSELTELRRSLERAGYYPELVLNVIETALAGEEISAQLVHLETTFDHVEVRRHVTALVLTPTRLVVAHVDDHPPESAEVPPSAAASTEAVPLSTISGVVLTHGVRSPATYRRGDLPDEVTLGMAWQAVHRIDIAAAQCPDQSCEVEHGMTGTISPDDIMIRVSTDAEGRDAVQAAISFGQKLSLATRSGAVPGSAISAIPVRDAR